jgi:hypothetical protein
MGDRRSTIPAAIVAMATLSWAAQCAACNPGHRYRQPTNFDLVRDADAIVIATAADQRALRNKDYAVHFRVDGALKGPAPREFDADFTSFADRSWWKTVPPSNPNELATANTQAYEGGCIRRLFTERHAYVVFLSKGRDGVWRELDWPFTRVNEDYFGERSLWIRTIRDYLAVQSLPEGWPQHQALERLLRARQAEATPEGKAEAEDVRRALRALSARAWRRWRRPY